MKFVTEFANVTLKQALTAKTALAAEGKTPEEIQAGLGEKYKYEGEKLTHLTNALDVASQNTENLKRVLVVSLSEGEKAPANAVQVEAFHYVPDFQVTARPAQAEKKDAKGGRGGGGKGRGGGGDRGMKESPWGLSQEQKAEKKAAQAKAASEKRKPNA